MADDQRTALDLLCTDVVKEHIRRVLEANLRAADARSAHIEELERAGRRIIGGGQTSGNEWELVDWRTGEVIAAGDDGPAGCDAACDRLDPDNTWLHIDNVDPEGDPYVTTPGMPPSFGSTIEDWVLGPAPDEEIAELVGWPVEKVREHL